MKGTNLQIFVLGALCGALFSYTYHWYTSLSTSHAFILSIKINFLTLQGRERFKDLFGEFATWIRENEPGTISYALAQSDKNQLELLITERYVNKAAYTDAHRSSPEFLAFKKKITEMNSESNRETLGWTLQGQSYDELNIGFM